MYGDSAGIMIYAQAGNPAGSYVIQVSPVTKATAADDWYNFSDATGDIIPPATAKGQYVDGLVTAASFRIAADAEVGADVTFKATKHGIV